MKSSASAFAVEQRPFRAQTRWAAPETTPLLAAALESFGLMSTFRAQPQAQQIADVSWVAEAIDSAEAHERIAHLLDELFDRTDLYL